MKHLKDTTQFLKTQMHVPWLCHCNNHEHFVHMILFIFISYMLEYNQDKVWKITIWNMSRVWLGMTQFLKTQMPVFMSEACPRKPWTWRWQWRIWNPWTNWGKKNRKKNKQFTKHNLKEQKQKKYPPERCGSGHDCLDLCVFQFVFDMFLVNQKNKTSDFRQGFCFCLFLGCPFYFDFLVS